MRRQRVRLREGDNMKEFFVKNIALKLMAVVLAVLLWVLARGWFLPAGK